MQDAEGNIWSADVGGRLRRCGNSTRATRRFTLYPEAAEERGYTEDQVTKDGAIWYSPRGSLDAPAFGVLYPDMDKITTLGAYYQNGPPGIRSSAQARTPSARPAAADRTRKQRRVVGVLRHHADEIDQIALSEHLQARAA
jgi:streptogramin lyase